MRVTRVSHTSKGIIMATSKQNKTKQQSSNKQDKPKAPKKTDPVRYAKQQQNQAGQYFINGGTMQVLARAFLVQAEGNQTQAASALALAIVGGNKDKANEYKTEATNYCRYADKHPEKEQHRTFAEARKLASA